jgi:hypothetical protein
MSKLQTTPFRLFEFSAGADLVQAILEPPHNVLQIFAVSIPVYAD